MTVMAAHSTSVTGADGHVLSRSFIYTLPRLAFGVGLTCSTLHRIQLPICSGVRKGKVDGQLSLDD
jgi:hypothetical protein